MSDVVSGSGPDRSGRRIVLEPVPPGFWSIVGGGIVAALAPLFGLLAGAMIGVGDEGDTSPLFVLLIIGIIIGGVGVAVMLMGIRRYYLYRREVNARDDAREAD